MWSVPKKLNWVHCSIFLRFVFKVESCNKVRAIGRKEEEKYKWNDNKYGEIKESVIQRDRR